MSLIEKAVAKHNKWEEEKSQLIHKFSDYCDSHTDEFERLNRMHFEKVFNSEIFGQYISSSDISLIFRNLPHEDGLVKLCTTDGIVWWAKSSEGFVFEGFQKFDSDESDGRFNSGSDWDNDDDDDDDDWDNEEESEEDTAEEARKEAERKRKAELINALPFPNPEDMLLHFKDCINNAKETDYEERGAWNNRANKLIDRMPMPSASTIVSEIRNCEQHIENGPYSIRDTWKSLHSKMVEYAKSNYTNEPSVKDYFAEEKKKEDDKEAYNKKISQKNKIAWGAWLVITIFFFAVSDEWYHYVFAVIGSVVVAAVAAILSIFVWDKK